MKRASPTHQYGAITFEENKLKLTPNKCVFSTKTLI